MIKTDKNNSIKYWNRHAKDWRKMAYDKNKAYLRFPSSGQREEITIKEIGNLARNKNVSIIDLGCGDGELVRNILGKGFRNVRGIDNSERMIAVAKQILKKKMSQIDANRIFSIDDVDSLKRDKTFDFVTGMGIIEYLLDIRAFFLRLTQILKPGGYAFIESKNKLFNLFSANKYTYKSDMMELVRKSDDVKRFSPVRDKKEIEKIAIKTFISIGNNLKNIKSGGNYKKPEFEKYPFYLPQYSPQEIEALCKKYNLKLKYVIYYHPHPFPPKFEGDFPKTFNRIALSMEPLGYTPLGAVLCSSFIAVIQK